MERDQKALKVLLDYPGFSTEQHMKTVIQCAFNSYSGPYELNAMQWKGSYMKGDFLVHFAGHVKMKAEGVKNFLEGRIYARK